MQISSLFLILKILNWKKMQANKLLWIIKYKENRKEQLFQYGLLQLFLETIIMARKTFGLLRIYKKLKKLKT